VALLPINKEAHTNAQRLKESILRRSCCFCLNGNNAILITLFKMLLSEVDFAFYGSLIEQRNARCSQFDISNVVMSAVPIDRA
jgi:hypothetical protein